MIKVIKNLNYIFINVKTVHLIISDIIKQQSNVNMNRKTIEKNIYIIKPGEDSCRGNGIFVTSDLEEIKNSISKYNDDDNKERTFIM